VLSKLRALRVERRLSQTELARRANLPQQYLSALERGIMPRRLADLDALAAALGVPAVVLLDVSTSNEAA
jgi:transcriptional regulator with XRE-family HTH domain